MADAAALEMRANRMDLVARWADDLAHEIKNPLHAMVINLELVKRRAVAGGPDAVVERAEIVEEEIRRVHALVDSMLRLVRPWPDRPVADLEELFAALLPVIDARSRVRRIEHVHESGAGRAALGAGELTLILLNLVDNAIDATPAGGRIETRAEADDARVRISVIDSGSGLPDALTGDEPRDAGDIAARVPARTGRPGLGLAVSSRLARRAGGTLTLRPAPRGTGVAALLTLPRAGSA